MTKSYDFQTYFYLDFPLDSIHIFKSNTILNGIFYNYELSLNECFLFYQSEKAMISSEDITMRCEYCNDSYDITSTNKLATGPKILVIILNRGEDKEKGHFIAFCKNPINSLWYKYNDDIVEQVNNFQNEVVNSNKPYILFYHLDH